MHHNNKPKKKVTVKVIEIPEAVVLAKQLNQTIRGKRINSVIAASSPHKFAWFFGEPSEYNALLQGRKIEGAYTYGGRVEVEAEDRIMHFGEGVNLRFYGEEDKIPAKHQLLVRFEDNTSLVCTIAMYGGIWCCKKGEMDDFYTNVSKEKDSPLSDKFDYAYFQSLINEKTLKLSAKAFLATEQRIPGLGNGVVQDILLNSKIHPKRKMNTLDDSQRELLFHSIKSTLSDMVNNGGRDTEKDLFGKPGGYKTKMSKANKAMICPVCGDAVRKENYMGGSIYYCSYCQKQS